MQPIATSLPAESPTAEKAVATCAGSPTLLSFSIKATETSNNKNQSGESTSSNFSSTSNNNGPSSNDVVASEKMIGKNNGPEYTNSGSNNKTKEKVAFDAVTTKTNTLQGHEEAQQQQAQKGSTSSPKDDKDEDEDEDSDDESITMPLYRQSDDDWLSPQLCLVRSQMVAFAATPHDVNERRSAGGSIVPPAVGQVGLRCIHCAHIPLKHRTKGSVLYPKSVRAIHMAMRNFQRHHLLKCPFMPETVKSRYASIKNKAVQSKKDSYIYLAQVCKDMGMIELGGCLRFGDASSVTALNAEPLNKPTGGGTGALLPPYAAQQHAVAIQGKATPPCQDPQEHHAPKSPEEVAADTRRINNDNVKAASGLLSLFRKTTPMSAAHAAAAACARRNGGTAAGTSLVGAAAGNINTNPAIPPLLINSASLPAGPAADAATVAAAMSYYNANPQQQAAFAAQAQQAQAQANANAQAQAQQAHAQVSANLVAQIGLLDQGQLASLGAQLLANDATDNTAISSAAEAAAPSPASPSPAAQAIKLLARTDYLRYLTTLNRMSATIQLAQRQAALLQSYPNDAALQNDYRVTLNTMNEEMTGAKIQALRLQEWQLALNSEEIARQLHNNISGVNRSAQEQQVAAELERQLRNVAA